MSQAFEVEIIEFYFLLLAYLLKIRNRLPNPIGTQTDGFSDAFWVRIVLMPSPVPGTAITHTVWTAYPLDTP